MSPESRAFLDLVRDAEDPTRDDEARVLGAVRAALAAGAAAGSVASVAGAAKAAKLGGLSGLSVVKVSVAVVGLTGGAWLIAAQRSPPVEPGKPPAAVVSASARPSSAPVLRARPPALASALEAAVAPPAPLANLRKPDQRRAPEPLRAPSLREEIALLADVQRALDRHDGARALGLLEGHVTADRQLAAERAAARIHALCALGRAEEARRAAVTFLRVFPASLQRGAVERSCAMAQPGAER